jgi:hypothetical protein
VCYIITVGAVRTLRATAIANRSEEIVQKQCSRLRRGISWHVVARQIDNLCEVLVILTINHQPDTIGLHDNRFEQNYML